MSKLLIHLDYSSSCGLIRKIPLSTLCSWNLPSSSITCIKVDREEQVHANLFFSLHHPETNISLYQDVYISDTCCQMLYKVNLPDSSCVPFGWRGRYAGPGKFSFAFPTRDRVMVFTDHSVITFLKDDTPCQSIILDDAITDAGLRTFRQTNLSEMETN